MRIRSSVFAAALATGMILAGPLPAAASVVLLENLTNIIQSGTVQDETRNPAFGILSRIEIGNADVDIDGFGVFGRQTSDGNVRFAIFNVSGFTRVYVSEAVATAASTTLQWYDSPSFTLTLLANNVYYFGLISDQAFVYRLAFNVDAVSANGLTSPPSNFAGSNGNVENFADPAMTDACCTAQMSLRITGPEEASVPEPGALALIGLGMAAVGILRRRRGC